MRPLAIVSLAFALGLAPSLTHAAGGIGMRWDHCYGDAGASNKSFACDRTTGVHELVVSFMPSIGLTQVTGVEMAIDAQTSSAIIPSWWQLRGGGHCRQGALSASLAPNPNPSNCVDIWGGIASGGIAGYTLNYPSGTDRIRMLVFFGLPTGQTRAVSSGVEYVAANVFITNTKTVGAGACAGCEVPVCLLASQLVVRRPVGVGNMFLSESFAQNSALASWQGGEGSVAPGSPNAVITSCSNTTSATRPTWGAIKSLYR